MISKMKIKSNGDDFMSSIESYEAYINQVAKIKDWHYIDLGEYLNEELKIILTFHKM